MSRSHFQRTLIDKNVGVIQGASVSVVEAGTNTLTDQILWKDPNTVVDSWSNPFISTDGSVDFYTDDTETVGLIISYGSTTVKIDYLDTLPPSEELVTTVLPLHIGNGASGGQILVGDGVGSASFIDPSTVPLIRTNLIVQSFTGFGTLTVSPGKARWYNDVGQSLTIGSVRASVGTAPAGASIIVDLKKNGSSVYTTTANRPTIAAGDFTNLAALPDDVAVDVGDYLSVDILQVGSSSPGSDLTVGVVLT